MKEKIHFNIVKSDGYYVAECVELAIVTDGKTLEEVIDNIKDATQLHLQVEDMIERDLVPSPVISINYNLPQIA